LLNHVERVLQMAKTDKGQLELKKEWFVWQHLLKAVVERHEETLQQYQVSIKWDMPEEDVTYFGDSLHLGNVISNLIDNAIKYNERTPCIDIQLRQTNHTITINVKDNGIGIEKKHIKRLFGKFYRVPTGNIHNVKGFGLGLNYVKSIIKMHGGTVRCLSEIDKGSQFIITLKNMGSREKI
jgi:two-component system phosphate regulon sensor histidine kinase PhoR